MKNNPYIFKFFLYFSILQCSSHQSVLVAGLGCIENHVKPRYHHNYKSPCFFFLILLCECPRHDQHLCQSLWCPKMVCVCPKTKKIMLMPHSCHSGVTNDSLSNYRGWVAPGYKWSYQLIGRVETDTHRNDNVISVSSHITKENHWPLVNTEQSKWR